MVRLLETVLHNKLQIVALVKHFAVHIWVNGLEPFDLLVFLGDQLLVHGRDFDVHIIVRKIEVGREILDRLAIFIELNRKTLRFVVPRNAIKVEKQGELPLTVVSELDFVRRGAVGDQVTPASTAPV